MPLTSLTSYATESGAFLSHHPFRRSYRQSSMLLRKCFTRSPSGLLGADLAFDLVDLSGDEGMAWHDTGQGGRIRISTMRFRVWWKVGNQGKAPTAYIWPEMHDSHAWAKEMSASCFLAAQLQYATLACPSTSCRRNWQEGAVSMDEHLRKLIRLRWMGTLLYSSRPPYSGTAVLCHPWHQTTSYINL